MRQFTSVEFGEFLSAPMPTQEDKVILSVGLGLTLSAGVPILQALNVTLCSTPSVRLRYVLHSINFQLREGKSIAEAAKANEETLGQDFVAAVCLDYNLSHNLLQFAKASHTHPHKLLSDAVERPQSVAGFTQHMATSLARGDAVSSALDTYVQVSASTDNFTLAIKRVYARYQGISSFVEALDKEDQWFDHLYVNVVKGGEAKTSLKHAFHLLAIP